MSTNTYAINIQSIIDNSAFSTVSKMSRGLENLTKTQNQYTKEIKKFNVLDNFEKIIKDTSESISKYEKNLEKLKKSKNQDIYIMAEYEKRLKSNHEVLAKYTIEKNDLKTKLEDKYGIGKITETHQRLGKQIEKNTKSIQNQGRAWRIVKTIGHKIPIKYPAKAIQGIYGASRVLTSTPVLGTLGAVGAIHHGLIGKANERADKAQQITNLQKKTGLSSEEIQGIIYGGEQNGATSDEAFDLIEEFNNKTTEAIKDGGNVREKFQSLGISMNELKRKSTAENLKTFMNAIKKAKDEGKNVDFYMDEILGDVGKRFTNQFVKGKEGLKQSIDTLKANGNMMSDENIKSSLKYKEATRKLSNSWDHVIGIVTNLSTPIFAKVAKDLSKWLVTNKIEIAKNIKSFINGSIDFGKQIWKAATKIPNLINTVSFTYEKISMWYNRKFGNAKIRNIPEHSTNEQIDYYKSHNFEVLKNKSENLNEKLKEINRLVTKNVEPINNTVNLIGNLKKDINKISKRIKNYSMSISTSYDIFSTNKNKSKYSLNWNKALLKNKEEKLKELLKVDYIAKINNIEKNSKNERMELINAFKNEIKNLKKENKININIKVDAYGNISNPKKLGSDLADGINAKFTDNPPAFLSEF